jgi:hypothetical protein
MKLSWNGYRYELVCTAAEKDLPKQAGMHYDFRGRSWWTGLSAVARGFEKYADTSAKEKLNREDHLISQSKALSPEEIGLDGIEIPCPKGLSYLPFQQVGILSILTRFGFDIETLRKKK